MTLDAVDVTDEVGAWNAVLRRYGAALDAHRSFLVSVLESRLPADVHELPLSFVPPAGMPPMPVELGDVADSLRRETDELIAVAAALLARSAPPAPNRQRPTGTSGTTWDRRL